MDKIIIDDVIIKRQEIIKKKEGNILKFLNKNESEFIAFGEAYFSLIKFNNIKAWRKHNLMTSNLIVPFGKVRIVVLDDRGKKLGFQEIELSQENFNRVTIPPGLWTGFKGLSSDTSIIFNLSNTIHDKNEQETAPMNNFDYDW